MKIGDKVKARDVRPDEYATVIDVNVNIITKHMKRTDSDRKEVRTKYTAEYDDGSQIRFYGFDIGTKVFLQNVPDGQMVMNLEVRE